MKLKKIYLNYTICIFLLIVILWSVYPIRIIESFSSDKVTVELYGGIGNKIFQVLAGLQYAEKYNKEFFITKDNILNDEHDSDNLEKLQDIFKNVKVIDKIEYTNKHDVDSTPFTYSELPYYQGNVLLRGVFQTEKYLPPYIPNIRTTYYPNTYFIHIRAGDYIGNSKHYVEFNKYYKKSIDLIRNKEPASKFILFSNDNDYAIEYMKKYGIQYKVSDTKTGYHTLIEMANCAGGICANSSLSWLGAYFQKQPRGIICMPDKWIHTHPSPDIHPSWATVISVT